MQKKATKPASKPRSSEPPELRPRESFQDRSAYLDMDDLVRKLSETVAKTSRKLGSGQKVD